MYSIPNDLMMSTMKSAPGRSVVNTSAVAGLPVSACLDIGGGVGEGWPEPCALTGVTAAANAATPAAEPFRKSRRLTASLFDLRNECPHLTGERACPEPSRRDA